ncbi:hypothetical protein CAURIC_00770 [Corynebacterium auriscanis]|nr:hypothetical protein CAURIC_00770 [Corynebacterium auriscanis]
MAPEPQGAVGGWAWCWGGGGVRVLLLPVLSLVRAGPETAQGQEALPNPLVPEFPRQPKYQGSRADPSTGVPAPHNKCAAEVQQKRVILSEFCCTLCEVVCGRRTLRPTRRSLSGQPLGKPPPRAKSRTGRHLHDRYCASHSAPPTPQTDGQHQRPNKPATNEKQNKNLNKDRGARRVAGVPRDERMRE